MRGKERLQKRDWLRPGQLGPPGKRLESSLHARDEERTLESPDRKEKTKSASHTALKIFVFVTRPLAFNV